MSLDYIRKTYGVPAETNGRIRYLGGKEPTLGRIIGAEGAHVMIRLKDAKHAQPFHPTWKLEYLNDLGDVIWKSPS